MQSTDILHRIENLSSNNERLWGSMSANQMLTHCADQLRICLGELPCRPRGNKLTQRVIKWVSLNLPLQMPKNMRTIAELDPNKKYMTPPKEFGQDHATLVTLYQKMLSLPETHLFEHPVFGKMNKKEVIKLSNMHLDHHLRQFGV